MSAKSHAARLKRMRNTEEVVKALYGIGQELELAMERGIVAGSITGKGHIPGPPGGFPNADSRDLDSKIDTTIETKSPPTVHVTAYSEHAVYQQFGTSKMAARPFATLATNEVRPSVAGKIAAAVRRSAK